MTSISQKPLSRRQIFLWGGAAVATVAAGGIGWQFRPTIPAEFPELTLGETASDKPHLLVVYGSGLGTTAEQAVWIGETVARSGFAVQVSRAGNAPRADAFDAVILGSAIRSSKWLPEIIDWAADNRKAMSEKPTALFEASMSVAGILRDTPDHRLAASHIEKLSQHLDDLHKAAPVLKTAPVAYLPGCLDYDRLTPVMRFAFPIASGKLDSGDFRNRQMVEDFARTTIESFPA